MTARKKYDDHGGVCTLEQALYHAVHDFKPGGLQTVAAVYNMSPGVLRQKVSLVIDTHRPTLDDMLHILELTRDPRILTAICEPVGAVWSWADQVNQVEQPSEVDLLGSGSAVSTAAANFIAEVHRALSDDGLIDPDERARIRQRSYELMQSISGMNATTERFEKGD